MFPVGALIPLVIGLRAAARTRRAAKPDPDPLCLNCAYGHIQWTVKGKRDLHCAFRHTLRPIREEVLHCTDFLPRGERPERRPIGFVPIVQLTDGSD